MYYIPTIDSAIQRIKVLIHATALMNLKNIVLSGETRPQKLHTV